MSLDTSSERPPGVYQDTNNDHEEDVFYDAMEDFTNSQFVSDAVCMNTTTAGMDTCCYNGNINKAQLDYCHNSCLNPPTDCWPELSKILTSKNVQISGFTIETPTAFPGISQNSELFTDKSINTRQSFLPSTVCDKLSGDTGLVESWADARSEMVITGDVSIEEPVVMFLAEPEGDKVGSITEICYEASLRKPESQENLNDTSEEIMSPLLISETGTQKQVYLYPSCLLDCNNHYTILQFNAAINKKYTSTVPIFGDTVIEEMWTATVAQNGQPSIFTWTINEMFGLPEYQSTSLESQLETQLRLETLPNKMEEESADNIKKHIISNKIFICPIKYSHELLKENEQGSLITVCQNSEYIGSQEIHTALDSLSFELKEADIDFQSRNYLTPSKERISRNDKLQNQHKETSNQRNIDVLHQEPYQMIIMNTLTLSKTDHVAYVSLDTYDIYSNVVPLCVLESWKETKNERAQLNSHEEEQAYLIMLETVQLFSAVLETVPMLITKNKICEPAITDFKDMKSTGKTGEAPKAVIKFLIDCEEDTRQRLNQDEKQGKNRTNSDCKAILKIPDMIGATVPRVPPNNVLKRWLYHEVPTGKTVIPTKAVLQNKTLLEKEDLRTGDKKQTSPTIPNTLASDVIKPLSLEAPPQSLEVSITEWVQEDVKCTYLMLRKDFLCQKYFGQEEQATITTKEVHFGEGMYRRAFRCRLVNGKLSLLHHGQSCVLKVHTAVINGAKSSEKFEVCKNYNLAVEECFVQNTAREYMKAYEEDAKSNDAFGEVPEIIPIYLVHRPLNVIQYATLEEELTGDFVKYSVRDGRELNCKRKESEAGQKCCAFQHWVFHRTEGNLLVTDMQGVGMKLTDVGIATCRKGYRGFKGNCATSFIDQFKALHQCNQFCLLLGLTSLQTSQQKR